VNGKTCIVTGANTGIGKATATALAKKGATVVMVCRSRERGEAARAEIARESGRSDVDLLVADLSLQSEIRRLAGEVQTKYPRLDVLINNAAVVHPKRILTAEGIETMFAVNHLAYYLLSLLLLEVLQASRPARIINVGSNAHRFIKKLDFDNLQGEQGFNSLRPYAMNKLENLYFTYALARRIEGTGVTVNALHPGVILTELNRSLPAPVVWFFNKFTKPTSEGAATPVYLALSPEVEGVNGKYFDDCREKKTSPASYDVEAAEKLWQLSARLTGEDLPLP
jgi:NAD(P)-dependent dehydrogenase (short-subunit alcohol dehydrogenase family)